MSIFPHTPPKNSFKQPETPPVKRMVSVFYNSEKSVGGGGGGAKLHLRTPCFKILEPLMITVKYVLILIRRLIKRSLDIHVGCFQLRTRYPTYSSFCVTTTERYADIIMCSNVWLREAKVMLFKGRRNNATAWSKARVSTALKFFSLSTG